MQMDTHEMKPHVRADGGLPGVAGMTVAAVDPLRPAIVAISASCRYLGDVSRAKFYADILPQLDVVKFGARTFVTIESLDRVIAANTRHTMERSSTQADDSPGAAANSTGRSDAPATGHKREKLGERTRAPIGVSLVGGGR